MQRRGYLLRFIDLGLIILFGFLMISDITVISQITLPGKSDDQTEMPQDTDQIFLGVSIEEDGVFTVNDLVEKKPLHVNITSAEELQFVLSTLKTQHADSGKVINLLIAPAPASGMQKLVDVLDVCDRLQIQKNINTEAVFEEESL